MADRRWMGKPFGLDLTRRKMKTWLGSGIIHLVNGMEMLMIKVYRLVKTTGFMLFQLSTLNSATRSKNVEGVVIIFELQKAPTSEAKKECKSTRYSDLE
ncbi:hypothetical protein L1987_11407 [Smallanthus sonchifolius]|uniref:Uncharacterized protein n=1 Tax=Smallanthus sonchifolius TaxID=185202 RepID=A0ACB9JBT5_9ASTR|nr:hypothetical protein L1987_11407 [Smallanthus sonchifolius]